MDAITLVILEVFALTLTLFGFFGNRAGWQVFPLFGGTVSVLTALVLAVDGNLVNGTQTLAAANGNFISDFNALTVLAFTLGLAPLVVAIRRIFRI
jgi:hypothetical protein